MSLDYDIKNLFIQAKVDQVLEIFKDKLNELYIQFRLLDSQARGKGLTIDDLQTSVQFLYSLSTDNIPKLRDFNYSDLGAMSDSLKLQIEDLLKDSVKELIALEANHETKKES